MNQLFYAPHIEGGFARFDEEESRHLVSVLRKKTGDTLSVTDGKGFFYEAVVSEIGKKHALAAILSTVQAPPERPARLCLAVAPTKQMERTEWLLEKAAEIGIDDIILLQCHRSERVHARIDRLEKILISAMKQSLRAYMPRLHGLVSFREALAQAKETRKLIAWCSDRPLPHINSFAGRPSQDTLILIGPEGDFTPEETAFALDHGFQGVSLGEARLRTETAGLFAVAAFNLAWQKNEGE